jgi:Snf7 protein
MREAIEVLTKKEAYLDDLCAKEKARAAEFLKKKMQTRALSCMKNAKSHERQILVLADQRTNLEHQIVAVESMRFNVYTHNAMHSGAMAMKKLSRQVNVDAVKDTADKVAEQMENAQQINEELAIPVGPKSDETDAELLDELREFIKADDEQDEDVALGVPEPRQTEPSVGVSANVLALAADMLEESNTRNRDRRSPPPNAKPLLVDGSEKSALSRNKKSAPRTEEEELAMLEASMSTK